MSEKTNQKPVKCGCGGEAEVLKFNNDTWLVMCNKCRTSSENYTSKDKAIEAWNTAMGADKVDELMEHVWRDKLDTPEKIADFVERMLRISVSVLTKLWDGDGER